MKKKRYSDINQSDFEFLPFILEAQGGAGKAAVKFEKELEKRKLMRTCAATHDRSKKLNLLTGLNIEVQRFNSTAILERVPPVEPLCASELQKHEHALHQERSLARERLYGRGSQPWKVFVVSEPKQTKGQRSRYRMYSLKKNPTPKTRAMDVLGKAIGNSNSKLNSEVTEKENRNRLPSQTSWSNIPVHEAGTNAHTKAATKSNNISRVSQMVTKESIDCEYECENKARSTNGIGTVTAIPMRIEVIPIDRHLVRGTEDEIGMNGEDAKAKGESRGWKGAPPLDTPGAEPEVEAGPA